MVIKILFKFKEVTITHNFINAFVKNEYAFLVHEKRVQLKETTPLKILIN